MGRVIRKILYVDVPAGLQNFDFRLPNFVPIYQLSKSTQFC